jgi:hypothetical protein
VGLGSIAVSGVGVIAAAVFAGIYFILMKESDFYRDLYCNDSQFTTLYKTAEAYAQLLAMGCDCEQEATDAWVEFYVYCLQKKHGDNWFIYCPSNIYRYYLDMRKRRLQPQSSDDSSSESGSFGDHKSPPGTKIA